MKDPKITGEELAFPVPQDRTAPGMTLKQYYVGQVLAGLTSRGQNIGDANSYAEVALLIANATIFYLNKELE